MDSVWPWLAVTLAALVAGAVLAWRLARRQHALQAALRESRDWARCLDELLEVGTWRTDSDHRLTHWRLPAAAANEPGPPAPLLWDVFAAADDTGLRDRLTRQLPLDDIEIETRPATIIVPEQYHYPLHQRAVLIQREH